MSSVLSSASQFYRNEIALSIDTFGNGERYAIIRDPLTRFDFIVGSGIALISLINELAQSVFSLVAILFTLGLNQGYRESFIEHLYGVVVYIVAWPIGLLGGIAPDFFNQSLLEIPPDGIRRELTPDEFRAYQNGNLIV